MNTLPPKYIGPLIDIKSIRNWILDSKLNESDTILLHPDDFDNIVLEYREQYRKSIPNPYYLLGVLIDEGTEINVPKGRIVVLIDDDRY